MNESNIQETSSGKWVWIVALFGGLGCLPIILFVVVLIGIGGFLIIADEDPVEASAGAFCRVDGDLDMDSFSNVLSNAGVFAGMESTFVSVASEFGIDPVLMAAIALHETGYGTSNAVVNKNNPGGLMNPATGSRELYVFPTLEEGLRAMGRTLHNRIIKDGLNTIDKLGSVYAPIGAANDPTGLNSHWVPNITKIANELGGLIMNCDVLSLGGEFLIPTMGQFVVTSPFGWRDIGAGPEFHQGIDLACKLNDPIIAARDGVIVYAEYASNGNYSTTYGNYIIVDHGDARTLYAHLNGVSVKVNDVVSAGTLIGACGTTGRSTGTHLHFEVQINGQRVDPYPYLTGGQS